MQDRWEKLGLVFINKTAMGQRIEVKVNAQVHHEGNTMWKRQNMEIIGIFVHDILANETNNDLDDEEEYFVE